MNFLYERNAKSKSGAYESAVLAESCYYRHITLSNDEYWKHIQMLYVQVNALADENRANGKSHNEQSTKPIEQIQTAL